MKSLEPGAAPPGATNDLSPSRPPEPSGPLPRGTAIGRYVLLGRLGEGGMGVVYLAHDGELDRKVALKLVRADAQDGSLPSEGRARLLREAQGMAKLSHANVVAIHDVGTFEEKVFLAMEYVAGETLKSWLKQPRTWREVIAVFREAGHGLAAAHAAGLVHRDFKPDNVLIGKDGRVRVTDFGLARGRQSAAGEAAPWASPQGLSNPLTQAGMVMGTPAYMAPEQVVGGVMDERTDLFSFCVALHEALYGERPFDGPFAKDGTRPLKPPAREREVPAWLREVVQRGLASRPEQRPPSMAALLELLADDPTVTRRRLAGRAGLGAMFAALAAVAALGWSHRKPDPCAHPERGLDGVWDDAMKAAGRAGFVGVGGAKGDQAWSRVERAIDRRAAAWVSGATAACEATRVQHTEPEVALQLRLTCLERQLDDWRSVMSFYQHPDATLLEHAAAGLSALPRSEDCASAAALALIPPVPPQLKDKVTALRARLAHSRVLTSIGRYTDANRELSPLVEDAKALGYCPAEAEIECEAASLQSQLTAYAAAAALAARAEAAATSCRTDAVAAQAASSRAISEAASGADPSVVNRDLEHAHTLALRLFDHVETQRLYESAAFFVASIEGDSHTALTHIKNELEIIRKAYGQDDPLFVYAEENYAVALDLDGHHEEALEANKQCREDILKTGGPESEDLLMVDGNTACLLAGFGRWSEAEAIAERYLAQQRVPDLNIVSFLFIRANARARRGDLQGALLDVQRGREAAAASSADKDPEYASVANFGIEALVLAGHPAEAVALYETGDALESKAAPNRESQVWLGLLLAGGKAYLAAGQQEKARALLERALEMANHVGGYPTWTPEIRYALAKALVATRGDRRRAAELAALARAELVKFPQEQATVAELDAWQASVARP